MQRITTSTKAVDLFGAGKHGFKDGDLPNGIVPTDFNADWANLVQEEIARAVEGAGIVLDGAVRNQLSLAIAAMIAAAAPPIAQGQCRLSKSGANLILLPYKGNRLMVNGVLCTIPDAGVTLAPPAVASTTYNIYAVATAGVITSLENSATAHVPDTAAGANKGVEIKTGDATRSMVGMARTTAANAWADTRAQRFVRSWFNDPKTEAGNALTANVNSTTTSYIELNSAARAEFLSWLGEPITIGTAGRMTNNAAGGDTSECSIGIDSAVARDSWAYVQSATGISQGPASAFLTISDLAEGYHYATMLGKAGGTGTTTWGGSATPGARSTISVKLG